MPRDRVQHVAKLERSDGAAAAQVTPFVKYFLNQVEN
jgi:hypothetical protein